MFGIHAATVTCSVNFRPVDSLGRWLLGEVDGAMKKTRPSEEQIAGAAFSAWFRASLLVNSSSYRRAILISPTMMTSVPAGKGPSFALDHPVESDSR